MSPNKETQKSAKSTTATSKKFKGFTDEERAAMTDHVPEMKASADRGPRACAEKELTARRGKDRRACEESGELRSGSVACLRAWSAQRVRSSLPTGRAFAATCPRPIQAYVTVPFRRVARRLRSSAHTAPTMLRTPRRATIWS